MRRAGRLQRLALVRVEPIDADPGQGLGEGGVERPWHRHPAGIALLFEALGDDPAVAAGRIDRDRPRRFQQALRHQAAARIAPATLTAWREELSWTRRT